MTKWPKGVKRWPIRAKFCRRSEEGKQLKNSSVGSTSQILQTRVLLTIFILINVYGGALLWYDKNIPEGLWNPVITHCYYLIIVQFFFLLNQEISKKKTLAI